MNPNPDLAQLGKAGSIVKTTSHTVLQTRLHLDSCCRAAAYIAQTVAHVA
jgi:hypothetical protein